MNKYVDYCPLSHENKFKKYLTGTSETSPMPENKLIQVLSETNKYIK